MSMVMNNMWTQEDLMREDDTDREQENEEVALTLPDNAFSKDKNKTDQTTTSDKASSQDEKAEDYSTGDVLTQMKEGTTLLKYGKYGSGGYRTFRLSKDHKYLVWFSQKKKCSKYSNPNRRDYGNQNWKRI
jgi:hypothetical protein